MDNSEKNDNKIKLNPTESETYDTWTLITDNSSNTSIQSENGIIIPNRIELVDDDKCNLLHPEIRRHHHHHGQENDEFSDEISILSESSGRNSPVPSIQTQTQSNKNKPDEIDNQKSIEEIIQPNSHSSKQVNVVDGSYTTMMGTKVSLFLYLTFLVAVIALFAKTKYPEWIANNYDLSQRVDNLELQNNLLRAEIDILSLKINYLTKDNDKNGKNKLKFDGNEDVKNNYRVDEKQSKKLNEEMENYKNNEKIVIKENPHLQTGKFAGQNEYKSSDTSDRYEKYEDIVVEEIEIKENPHIEANEFAGKKDHRSKEFFNSNNERNSHSRESAKKDNSKEYFDSKQRNFEKYESNFKNIDKIQLDKENMIGKDKKYKERDDKQFQKDDWKDKQNKKDDWKDKQHRRDDWKDKQNRKDDWHEKMMKSREEQRKEYNEKRKRDDGWYINRASGREEARTYKTADYKTTKMRR